MFDIIGKDPSTIIISYIVKLQPLAVVYRAEVKPVSLVAINGNIYLQHIATYVFLQLLLDLFVANNDA